LHTGDERDVEYKLKHGGWDFLAGNYVNEKENNEENEKHEGVEEIKPAKYLN
jgi:hypothetical protein